MNYTLRLFEGSPFAAGSGFIWPRVPLDEFHVTSHAQPALPMESTRSDFRRFKDATFVATKPIYCDGALLIDEDDMVLAVMSRERQYLNTGDSMTIAELWVTEAAFS